MRVGRRTGPSSTGSAASVKRLNWGCGTPEPGWINADRKEEPGIDINCDIRVGLPLESDSLDYAVSIHALPEIPYPDLVATLEELRRVLKPGGVLRLGLPDLDKGIHAYLNRNEGHFLVPDDEMRSLGGKFIVHMIWYGYSRSLFNFEFIEELLLKAGFVHVTECLYQETKSPFREIIDLDNREHESLFVEATK
jgi:predicted SAM-dependent methyltransferase